LSAAVYDSRSLFTTADRCLRQQIAVYDSRSLFTTADRCLRQQIAVYDSRSAFSVLCHFSIFLSLMPLYNTSVSVEMVFASIVFFCKN